MIVVPKATDFTRAALATSIASALFLFGPATASAQGAEESQPPPPPTIEMVDPQVVAELEERLRATEDLLDKVETRSLLQRIRWTGDYRTLVTHNRYSGPSPDGARDPMTGAPVDVDLQNDEQWLHRLRLNLEAQPYKDLRFTGRLTMFKRYGTNTATLFAQDSSETRIPRDNAIRLERAWIDWFVHDKVALSMGRVSYSNGSPAELKENLLESDASWGLHMVDGEYETVNLTASPTANLLMRAFYISWAFPLEDDLNSLNLPLTNGTKNLRILGANVDIKAPKLGALAHWVSIWCQSFVLSRYQFPIQTRRRIPPMRRHRSTARSSSRLRSLLLWEPTQTSVRSCSLRT